MKFSATKKVEIEGWTEKREGWREGDRDKETARKREGKDHVKTLKETCRKLKTHKWDSQKSKIDFHAGLIILF